MLTYFCVKGRQKNTTYYQTNISYGEIEHMVKLPEEVLGDDIFDSDLTMQRRLNKIRVKICFTWISISNLKTKIEIIAIIKLLVTAAKEIEIVTSEADKGA